VPSARATLDIRYAASLARIPDGTAKTQGIAFGVRAADSLIQLRAHDGRNADIQFTQLPGPGVWRPTPPGLPMSAPWLGFVTPLLAHSATQFAPPAPPALTSARYTRDFAEVKALGSVTSTARTPEQTSTAQFFSGNPLVQYNAALRDQVSVRHLDIVDTARMFAAIDMSVADAEITVWHAKYSYGLWRPVTAIGLADTDGNSATSPDPSWVPMITTPPYPEYPSGVQRVQLNRDPRPGNPVPDPAPAADAHLHGRARHRAPLRPRRRTAPGCRRCQGVGGHPLPHRRHRRQEHRGPARRLDHQPLLPARPRRR